MAKARHVDVVIQQPLIAILLAAGMFISTHSIVYAQNSGAGYSDLNCDGAVNVLDVQWVILGALGAPLSASLDANQDGVHDGCGLGPPLPVIDENGNGVFDLCESTPMVADVTCGQAVCGNCPSAPSKCPGGEDGYDMPSKLAPVEGCGSPFVMYRDEADEAQMKGALNDVIVRMNANGVPGDGLAEIGIIGNSNTLMNRSGKEVSSIPAHTGYFGSFSVGEDEFIEQAFRFGGSSSNSLADFEDGYSDKDYWEVQGVTGNHDATGEFLEKFGTLIPGDGKRFMFVSFYHSDELGNGTDFPKGVRVAFVDVTNLDGVGSSDQVRYRLFLLVRPEWSGGKGSFGPVLYDSGVTSNHAGGLGWFRGENGNEYLYVPDTSTGIRIFDLNEVLRVTETDDKLDIGRQSGDTYAAFGYQYVIPEVARYRLCESSCCLRFSTVSIDRSSTPPALVTGEYDSDSDTNRIVRWPLNVKTGLPLHQSEANGGDTSLWVASEAFYTGVSKVQGVLMLGDHTYITTTQTDTGGTTYAHGKCFHANYRGGPISSDVCPSYPEGMYFDGQGIWTCTEKPGNRYCVRFNREVFSSF